MLRQAVAARFLPPLLWSDLMQLRLRHHFSVVVALKFVVAHREPTHCWFLVRSPWSKPRPGRQVIYHLSSNVTLARALVFVNIPKISKQFVACRVIPGTNHFLGGTKGGARTLNSCFVEVWFRYGAIDAHNIVRVNRLVKIFVPFSLLILRPAGRTFRFFLLHRGSSLGVKSQSWPTLWLWLEEATASARLVAFKATTLVCLLEIGLSASFELVHLFEFCRGVLYFVLVSLWSNIGIPANI